MTPDSVTDGEYSVAGWNRYMYCAGNPVRYKDPSGHYIGVSTTVNHVNEEEGIERKALLSSGQVEEGDNLWNIAKETVQNEIKFQSNDTAKKEIEQKLIKSKVSEIKKLNNLKSSKIKPGQILFTGKIEATSSEFEGAEAGDITDMMLFGSGAKIALNSGKALAKGITSSVAKKAITTTFSKKGQLMLKDTAGKISKQNIVNLTRALLSTSNKLTKKFLKREITLKFATSKSGSTAMKAFEAFETMFTPGIPDTAKFIGGSLYRTFAKCGFGFLGYATAEKYLD